MQYNKVQICGTNTADLKTLSEDKKRELLLKIKNGTKAEKELARQEMIQGNLRLVLSVMKRFSNRGENPDDLFQVGCIGLIKAIDNFNVNLNVKFSTYGVPMIIGEIRRFLRDNSSVKVSRYMKDIAYKAMKVKEKIIETQNREPSVEEVAKELGVPKNEVVLALESVIDPISLYEPIFSDGNDPVFVMDQIGDQNDDKNWIDELSFKEAMKNLSHREKKIMILRFFRGKTQTEVANEIGISQAQVSRLEKGFVKKIKRG